MGRSVSSFGATKPNVGRTNAPNVSELVDMLEWGKKGGSIQVRIIGGVAPRGTHKIKVVKRTGEETEITKTCLAYDAETDSLDADKECPYCKLDKKLQRFSKVYFANVIDRRMEEDAPAKQRKTPEELKSGIKSPDSSSWTPVRVIRAPSTLALRFKQLGERNVVKSGEVKKAFPVNHPKYGFDIDVSFDKSLPAASMYSADRNTDAKYTPLTEEEKAYLKFDLDVVYPPEELSDAKEEAKSLKDRWEKAHPEDADEDDDDETPSNKKKPVKKTKKSVDEDIDLDDEEDEEPVKKKSKKKPVVEDDDDDDDDELDLDDDDDEDDEPVKKKSKKKPVEDDDEDDELDLDDDDDDEPVKKKPVKKSAKKKPVDEDEDDEDDLDDDEDEEDDEPVKKKPVKKSAKKKPVDEDEDDEDDLDLDDDEDEDEPPKKLKKPTRRKVVQDDEDDDDIPF